MVLSWIFYIKQRIYNLITKIVMEFVNMVINDEQCAETYANKAQSV